MKFRRVLTGGALALALALTGCGSSPSGGGTTGGSGGNTLTVGTDQGSELKFVPDRIEAPANTEVTLVFNNESDTQPHNLKFQEVIQAGTKDIVNAGESETIQFTTPAAGEYQYVCTLHLPGMVGTLVIE